MPKDLIVNSIKHREGQYIRINEIQATNVVIKLVLVLLLYPLYISPPRQTIRKPLCLADFLLEVTVKHKT